MRWATGIDLQWIHLLTKDCLDARSPIFDGADDQALPRYATEELPPREDCPVCGTAAG